MRARDLLYMKLEKNVSADFKPGVNKSRAADRRDTFVLGLSVWNWLHVSLLAPRISNWLLYFWKIFEPVL
jgi:hypothetical protein